MQFVIYIRNLPLISMTDECTRNLLVWEVCSFTQLTESQEVNDKEQNRIKVILLFLYI